MRLNSIGYSYRSFLESRYNDRCPEKSDLIRGSLDYEVLFLCLCHHGWLGRGPRDANLQSIELI